MINRLSVKLFELVEAKGGEGSRGGHVIGHTKSGKAIYASGNSKSDTKKWSSQDHLDAAAAHDQVANQTLDTTKVLSDGAKRFGGSPATDKAMSAIAKQGNKSANLAHAHRVAAQDVDKKFNKEAGEKPQDEGVSGNPRALALGTALHIGLPKTKKPSEADSSSSNAAVLRGKDEKN